MKPTFALFLATVLIAAGPSGPVSGWTLDSRSATVRAVTGIPGALRLADPLVLPFRVVAAEFSATGDAAVLLTSDAPAHLFVLNGLPSTPVPVDLGEVAEGTRLLAANAKGTAALLYTPARNELRFVNAIGGNAALSPPVSTAALAGPVTAGILDGSGQCAVLGTGALEILCADGASRRVLSETQFNIAALAFANNERDLWFADAAGKQIVNVKDYVQSSSAAIFASSADGVSRPVALAVTATGTVLAADSEAQAIFAIDPAAASVQVVPLEIVPSQLRPLTDRSLLLINDLNSLPFTLFATEPMRTYFVPAN